MSGIADACNGLYSTVLTVRARDSSYYTTSCDARAAPAWALKMETDIEIEIEMEMEMEMELEREAATNGTRRAPDPSDNQSSIINRSRQEMKSRSCSTDQQPQAGNRRQQPMAHHPNFGIALSSARVLIEADQRRL